MRTTFLFGRKTKPWKIVIRLLNKGSELNYDVQPKSDKLLSGNGGVKPSVVSRTSGCQYGLLLWSQIGKSRRKWKLANSVYILLNRAMNSRKFWVQKRVGFLEPRWLQREDIKTLLHALTPQTNSLTGWVTTLPTFCPQQEDNERSMSWLLDSFFHISPMSHQGHAWFPHFLHVALSEISQHCFSASIGCLVGMS